MGNLKTKVRTVAKKAVAREVGRQVERVIKRKQGFIHKKKPFLGGV